VSVDWNQQLVEQLDFHWTGFLRPRLDGLTDDEYFWEPVEGCWNVRPRGTGTAPINAGSGDYTIDFALPEPQPAPVTTIAWRLAHIIVPVFGRRVATHFDGPMVEYQTFHYAGSAIGALRQLDEAYALWIEGVRGLGQDGLARPCGPSEHAFAEYPMAALVLHIHREAIHHAAEVALLRDLYLHRGGSPVTA
jgi:hypothetical protein